MIAVTRPTGRTARPDAVPRTAFQNDYFSGFLFRSLDLARITPRCVQLRERSRRRLPPLW
jgi:hypothetical protein